MSCCCCGGSGGNGGGLGITSGISALLSLIVIAVAITTGEWLLTEERLPKSPSSNATAEPDSKVTYSGLWRVCATLASHMQYECFNIDYFPSEEYSPDPNDSTMAIPYAVTKSTMFFLAATLLLVTAEVCYFAAHISHPKHRLCVFIAGVVFIVSGLLMLVGMVMYISVFKAEVGSKLRTRSAFQGPQFTYRYGFSFLLYVSGFITTEVAGTSAIFLYISWHQEEWIRKDSRRKNYGIVDLPNAFRRTPAADGLFTTPSTSIHVSTSNWMHIAPSEFTDFSNQGVYHLENHVHQPNHVNHHHNHGSFLCERHQKRYFFGRDSVDVDFDEFLPPPPSLDYMEYPRQFPRDLTAQTVSTTADVLQEEYSPSAHHEFVTFDLEEPLPPPPPVRGSEWALDTLRRTTPV